MSRPSLLTLGFLAIAAVSLPTLSGAEPTADDFDFFERRVRPVLVKNCHECHGPTKQKGGLRLDSRDAVLKGGESGLAVVPGKPAEGLMVDALNYGAVYQMPPKSKLPAEEIAALTEWVRRGVPWPQEKPSVTATASGEFNLAERAKHWSFQPVKPQQPPAVKNAAWLRGDIDKFLLAKLENAGLSPAAPAGKRTWLRRVSFDLTGLPPTPDEVAAFLRDDSPQAEEKVVDRLLASPHFGERWARHWLDLVRYAETMGHEFDYPIHNAWMYRDYVIRALNADVPYDQFVTEHVAGDLLKTPRRNPADGTNESVVGTSFYWFGEASHSPVDIKQAQCDRLDNQIDVLGKAFLGLTVACARCHDHKFDAITTKDYYALFGILQSTRFDHAAIDAVDKLPAVQNKPLMSGVRERVRKAFETDAQAFGTDLLAAATRRRDTSAPASVIDWGNLLGARGFAARPEHPLYPFVQLTELNGNWRSHGQEILREIASVQAKYEANSDAGDEVLIGDFSRLDHNWTTSGEAFTFSPKPGEIAWPNYPPRIAQSPFKLLTRPCASSEALPGMLEGAVRRPTFTISKDFIHVYGSGLRTRINIVIDGFTLIRSPIYGELKQKLSDKERYTFNVSAWRGHQAADEVKDTRVSDPADPNKNYDNDEHTRAWPANDSLAVATIERVVESDQSAVDRMRPSVLAWIKGRRIKTEAELASVYNNATSAALDAWAVDSLPANAEGEALTALLGEFLSFVCDRRNKLNERATGNGESESRESRNPFEIARLQNIGLRTFVCAVTDGNGLDAPLLIRGNHKTPGEVVPRRFLEALGGEEMPPIKEGSGRRELAAALVDPANPLMTRVYVNRLWHHLFGRGIVATVDNFGIQGQKPSHPELLDWLATRFLGHGWSTKKLLREMALSQAYRMTSDATDEKAEAADPANLLLHRMRVRRLEGEIVRDNLLAVSQRLDRKLFGPSIPVHLTPFMEGRGRPNGDGGPLDGDGRRSVYVEVRRNFLSPMMLAFDVPAPASCMGRRTVSNVPSQALIMLNDPLVQKLAEHWAKQLLSARETNEVRIHTMYLTALARKPSRNELSDALAFLKEQANAYGVPTDKQNGDVKLWTDLCHVMFNLKEFIFIE